MMELVPISISGAPARPAPEPPAAAREALAGTAMLYREAGFEPPWISYLAIVDALAPYGTRVILTSADHPNGTSRLAEAAAILNLAPDQIVVNVQGDEPELDPAIIDAAVSALVATRSRMATAAAPMSPGDVAANPAIVKVVCRADGTALYFSRSLIPFDRDQTRAAAQLGITRRALKLRMDRLGIKPERSAFDSEHPEEA